MLITLGYITNIESEERREVKVKSLYGHGEFICELLFASKKALVWDYVLVFVLEQDGVTKAVGVLLPRDSAYENPLSNIRIYFEDTEIYLDEDKIDLFIVDRGYYGIGTRREKYPIVSNIDLGEESASSDNTDGDTGGGSGDSGNGSANSDDSSDIVVIPDTSSIFSLGAYAGAHAIQVEDQPRSRRIAEIHLDRNGIEITKRAGDLPITQLKVDDDSLEVFKYSRYEAPEPSSCPNDDSASDSEQNSGNNQNQQENANVLNLRSHMIIGSKGIKLSTWRKAGVTQVVDYDRFVASEHFQSGDMCSEIFMDDDEIMVSVGYPEQESIKNKIRLDRCSFEIVTSNSQKNHTNEIFMDDKTLYIKKNDKDGKNYFEMTVQQEQVQVMKKDSDEKNKAVIVMKDDELGIYKVDDTTIKQKLKMTDDNIIISSPNKGMLKMDNNQVVFDGIPQAQGQPSGAFCAIAVCPITGLPHQTPVMQVPGTQIDTEATLS